MVRFFRKTPNGKSFVYIPCSDHKLLGEKMEISEKYDVLLDKTEKEHQQIKDKILEWEIAIYSGKLLDQKEMIDDLRAIIGVSLA